MINFEVEGHGRHVILLHGVGSHLQSWDSVVAALRDELTLLRYDLRGHGKSGKPPGPYALDDYVADLAALLDAQSVDRTTLVGFSFGGMIAPAFTVRHPERVRALGIVSAVAGRTPEQRAAVVKRADELGRGGGEHDCRGRDRAMVHARIPGRESGDRRATDPAGAGQRSGGLCRGVSDIRRVRPHRR